MTTRYTTWTHSDEFYETEAHMDRSQERYGDFTSTHEALGVALEAVESEISYGA